MKLIGHRGARGLAPENTLASMRTALKHHIDGIEFDIRITTDGIPAVMHDPFVVGKDGNQYKICDYTFDELVEVSPSLINLEMALDCIDKQAVAFIEIKPGENPQPVIQVIQNFLNKGWQPADFMVLSFDFLVLSKVHIAIPTLPLMVNEEWSSIRAVSRARRLETKNIDFYERWLWSGLIHSLHRRGYNIYSYTINEPRQARSWAKHGLTGAITDFPDRFV